MHNSKFQVLKEVSTQFFEYENSTPTKKVIDDMCRIIGFLQENDRDAHDEILNLLLHALGAYINCMKIRFYMKNKLRINRQTTTCKSRKEFIKLKKNGSFQKAENSEVLMIGYQRGLRDAMMTVVIIFDIVCRDFTSIITLVPWEMIIDYTLKLQESTTAFKSKADKMLDVIFPGIQTT